MSTKTTEKAENADKPQRTPKAYASGKLTAMEAIVRVLSDNGSPMKVPDIIKAALPLTALKGQHPGQAIYSAIYSNNKKTGEARMVKQVDRGTFALASSSARVKPQPAAAKTESSAVLSPR
jgi:hypothetical protein